MRMLTLDAVYSWSALVLLLTGVALCLTGDISPGNYFEMPLFNAVLGLFVLLAVVSVYPSMVLLRFKDRVSYWCVCRCLC